jgi:hypothetical protein
MLLLGSRALTIVPGWHFYGTDEQHFGDAVSAQALGVLLKRANYLIETPSRTAI